MMQRKTSQDVQSTNDVKQLFSPLFTDSYGRQIRMLSTHFLGVRLIMVS